MTEPDRRARMVTTLVIVGGSFDPSDCTEALGIAPTKTCAKGKRRREFAPPAEASEWVWQAGWLSFYDLDESVRLVVERFWPVPREVQSFVGRVGARAAVVTGIEIHHDRPMYGLSRQTIERLAALGAEYSMNLYDFSKD